MDSQPENQPISEERIQDAQKFLTKIRHHSQGDVHKIINAIKQVLEGLNNTLDQLSIYPVFQGHLAEFVNSSPWVENSEFDAITGNIETVLDEKLRKIVLPSSPEQVVGLVYPQHNPWIQCEKKLTDAVGSITEARASLDSLEESVPVDLENEEDSFALEVATLVDDLDVKLDELFVLHFEAVKRIPIEERQRDHLNKAKENIATIKAYRGKMQSLKEPTQYAFNSLANTNVIDERFLTRLASAIAGEKHTKMPEVLDAISKELKVLQLAANGVADIDQTLRRLSEE